MEVVARASCSVECVMPHLLSAPGGAGTRLHATSTVTSLTSGSCLHQTTSSSRPSCPRPPSAPFLQRCVVQKRRPTLTRRAPRPIGTLEFRAVQALRMPPPHTTPTIPPPAPPVAVSCRTVGVAPSYSDTLLSAPLPPTPLPLLAALNCAAHHKHTHAHIATATCVSTLNAVGPLSSDVEMRGVAYPRARPASVGARPHQPEPVAVLPGARPLHLSTATPPSSHCGRCCRAEHAAASLPAAQLSFCSALVTSRLSPSSRRLAPLPLCPTPELR